MAYVKKIVTALCKKKQLFDLNCVDPLGRNAIVIAIENENIEMIQFLLEAGIELKVRVINVLYPSVLRSTYMT